MDFKLEDISLHNKEQILEQDDNAITDKLDSSTTIEALLVKPNINEDADVIKEIMEIVNVKGLSAHKSWAGSTVIEPGNFRLVSHNGKIEVAGPGRWRNNNLRSQWLDIVSVNVNNFNKESFSFIRVPKGSYGRAMYNGKPLMLAEGLHVRNDRLFTFTDIVDVNQEIVKNGTINILRIPKGKYCLVVENNVPKILKSGQYAVDSNYFKVCGTVDIISPYICHQTIHIIRVLKSQVCLVTVNNKPKLLYEGNYMFNSPLIQVGDTKNINDEIIKHSTITRIRLKNGNIALAWYNNKPIFIDVPKLYEFDDPTFIFQEFKSATDKEIVLGSRRRIIVYDGEVGISYVKGRLEILSPNTYIFDSNDQIFKGFMSIRQQGIQLIEDGGKDFLCCDTKDFVEIGIKAEVYFRVSDPKLTLMTVGDEKAVTKIIKDTAIAILQGIIRSSALKDIAQSKVVSQSDENKNQNQNQNPFDGPKYFDKVHDEFISKLHDSFKTSYGIEISNIRIESFKIMNAKLSASISEQATITATTETQLANLESQREIAITKQTQDADVTRIKATAEALKLATETQAKNNAIISDAQTQAESIKVLALAQAQAITIKTEAEALAKAMSIQTLAKAEADAIKMKADADAKAMELMADAKKRQAINLDTNDIGKEIAKLEIQAEMVTKSMQGVQKMIYLPPGANMGNIPLQLFGINGGLPIMENNK